MHSLFYPPAPPKPRAATGAVALASFGGVGFFPWGPGTAGTVATLPLYWLLVHYTNAGVYIAVTLLLLIAGVLASEHIIIKTAETDPGWIVIDEVVGFLVAMTLIPADTAFIVAGFVLFRVFDILKPAGIRDAERMHGGLGVMMDDFAAGVLTNVILQLAIILPLASG